MQGYRNYFRFELFSETCPSSLLGTTETKTQATNTSAGILGLYTTYELLQKGIDPHKITIIAQHVPGDFVPEYASPYAGAYFSATIEESLLPFALTTYFFLPKLKAALGENCGLENCIVREFIDEPLPDSHVEKLQILKRLKVTKELVQFEGWVFNPPLFTKKLLDFLISKGVSLEQRRLNHVEEAPDSKYIINCTGNGARALGGVEDKDCQPVRGQVVVIKAPHVTECVSQWGEDPTYIIPRPDSDEVVLGGFHQVNNVDSKTYEHETQDIIRRTTELYPKILDRELEIIRVVAGFRPARKSGPRVERETVGQKNVIHNYGAGGCGYLMGLGMAHRAVKLIH